MSSWRPAGRILQGLETSPLPLDPSAIPLGFAALAALATALFVGVRAHGGPRAWTLVGVCLAIGGWLGCLFVAYGWFDPRFARLSILFSTFCAVLIPHFAVAMGHPLPRRVLWRWLVPHYAVALVLASLVLGTRWIWDEMGFVDGRYFETYGPGIAVFVPFTVGGFGFASYRLVAAARRATGTERLRLHWVLLGIGGTVVLCVATNLILPVLGFQGAMLFGPLSTLILFVCTAVAVVRFQLMGIRTVLHVTASWLVVSVIAMLPLAALLALFRPWLTSLGSPAHAASLLCAFVVFQQFTARVQPRVDHWFGRGRHQTAAAVRRLVEELGHLAEPRALCQQVIRTVALFYPQSATVWVVAPGERSLVRAAGFGAESAPERLVVEQIAGAPPSLGVYEVERGTGLHGLLPPGHGLALAIPLVVANRLVGLLGVGPKRTLAPYDSVDQALLRSVGASAAVSLANALTYQQAIRDPLTGLYNRMFASEVLHQEVARGQRHGTPFGLLLVDLDDFKEVNDTHGHPAGDAVLLAVGERLRGCVRESDVVARLGGDEFLVLLRGVDGEPGVAAAAATVEAAIRATPVIFDGIPIGLGASVGQALSPTSGTDEATLMRAVDADLYARKRAKEGTSAASK